MLQVIGRDAELHAADRFLDAAAERLSVLVIRGHPGIGKTTVWAETTRRAEERGFLVLTARAAAAEAQLTLTTLADLIEPVVDSERAALPISQQAALDGALLRTETIRSPLQPRLLGTATRSLLERIAARQPVIVAIDDAQWADRASATTLGYALRRMSAAPVGVLLAHRNEGAMPFDLGSIAGPDQIATVDVGPLSVAALHHVLKERTGASPSRSTLIRIHEASGGSPLFALEISRLLESVGTPPPGEPLPVPADVWALVRRRIRHLPATTREVLLLAATLGRSPLVTIEAALGRSVADGLDVAVRDDIAHIEGEQVVFRHPLFAGAVQAEATAADRRLAHRRLGEVVGGDEERARHRALGADAPSAALAEELERAARNANARGAPASAVDLMELAIAMTPVTDREGHATRTIALAQFAYRAGDARRAQETLEEIIKDTEAPLTRARARLALAGIRYETDATSSAVELAAGALVDADGEPELLAQAHATLAAVDWENFNRREAHIRDALRLLAGVAEPDPVVLGLALMERCQDDVAAGRPLDPGVVERALELERRAAPPSVSERFSASLGTWLKYLDDFDGARLWMERTYRSAVDEGDDGSLPYAISHFPELELWTGNWPAAEAAARRHFELAEELSLESQRRQALYNLGLVYVHQGRVAEARAAIEQALAAAGRDDDLWTMTSIVPLLGLLELSLGNAARAAGHLIRATELRDRVGQASPRRHDPDLVESLVAIGDLDRAGQVVAEMEARAERYDRHSARANAARARALVAAASGDLDGAVAAAERALAEHDLAEIAFDRARTLLVLGQVRRRHRERGAAKAAFEAALETFEALGARLWIERTRDELARTGLRRSSGPGLTENERRVAELAASGMTNREVAATLFLSPKTVEANLSRAYE